MVLRGTTWHAALLVLSLVPGCFDMHGRPGATPDAGTVPPRADASVHPPLARDAAVIDAGGYCGEAIRLIREGVPASELGCDGRTFPRECGERVGLCCQLSLFCAVDPGDGGHLEAQLSCDDSCEQSCALQTLDDCALFPYCERFDPGACGPAPEGVIEGPACIDRRHGPCASDADCELGTRCREHWVNPCLGRECDACGGTESFCS